MWKMHIFAVLLIYVLVSTSHFFACVHGFTYSITFQNQGVSFSLESTNRRQERDTMDQMLMEEFQAFDGNGDKKVSAAEVKAAWKGWYGLDWAEEDILLAFDRDGDGELNVEEYQDYNKDGDKLYFYKKMDSDSDGYLTRAEMYDSLKLWGMPEEVSQKRVTMDYAEADVNNDDKWDFTEFKEWMVAKAKDMDFIQEDFNALDMDSNGLISTEEQKQQFLRIGAIEKVSWSNMIIMMFDMDKDGFLNFYEYANGMYMAFAFKMDPNTITTFLAYDWNADMKVTAAEIKSAWMRWYGVAWSEEDILLTFDKDNDGELNIEEFHQYHKDGDTLFYYKKMDTDKNGLLTREELLDACKRWGMSDEVSKRRIAEDFSDVDVNDDDGWAFVEFKEWMAVKGKEEEFIRDDFSALDKDSNGLVSAAEHVAFVKRIGADERALWGNILIEMFDQDKDGLLNFEEYAYGMYGYEMESPNRRRKRDTVDQSTMEYFQAFDGNGDEKVSAAEVKAAWKAWYSLDWAEENILMAFDSDRDGELNMEEYNKYNKDGDTLYYYTKMDQNSDGSLTRAEMLNSLTKWGMPEEVSQWRLTQDFAQADVNSDDQWDFAEFKEWMDVKGKEGDFIQDAFYALDTDSNGFISAEEQKQFLLRIGASERVSWSNMMIMMFDADQDGFLNLYEYAYGMFGYVA